MPAPQRLVFVVPYRATTQPEREAQLRRFLSDVHAKVPGSLLMVAEQCDDSRKFNRGALFNAAVRELPRAFDVSVMSSDVLCFHDVDMIPEEALFRAYTAPLPAQTVRHVGAVARYRGLGSAYLGGIVMIRASDYVAVNGHSNSFWGWGGEDDEFHRRLKARKFTIERVAGEIEDMEGFVQHADKTAHNAVSKNAGRNKRRGTKQYKSNPGLLELEYALVPDNGQVSGARGTTQTSARITVMFKS